MSISIAIPTYNRQRVAVETIERLLPLGAPIIVVDQTAAADERLAALPVQLIRLPEPSIPHAMNVALTAATTDLVLFLDDDILPTPQLVAAHARAHEDESIAAVVGQILQPGEEPRHQPRADDDLQFAFNHDEACDVTNVMAGNLSVKRDRALQIGGFDENYVGAAYRFESDFALRLAAAGFRIRFEPAAGLRHLKLATGGLRSFGDHRVTISPLHAVGDYYFALHHRRAKFWRYSARRLISNVATRYHLKHPWMIPTKVIGELRAMVLARKLDRRGPQLLRNPGNTAGLSPIPRDHR